MNHETPRAARAGALSACTGAPAPDAIEALRDIAFERKYDIQCIAEYFGVSPRQFRQLFRARMNCNPHQWLREERMQRSRQMLRESSSVKEVAYALGFKRESQFCRDFKLRFGRTPSAELAPSSRRFSALFEDIEG